LRHRPSRLHIQSPTPPLDPGTSHPSLTPAASMPLLTLSLLNPAPWRWPAGRTRTWRRALPMAPEAARQEPPSRGGKSPSTRPLRLRHQGPTAPDPGASSRRRSRRLLMHLVMAGVAIQSTFWMLASSLCCNHLLRRWTSATSRQFLKIFLQPVELCES
uniref:Uncharacterized protein n=2 Tax=Aegilops tauschii subsp. strangulata TaxID=200361 RepID=A0A453AXR8_AEGTS